MSTASDEALVYWAQQGEQTAVCELLERYDTKTYHLAYRLMGNHADAADAAQEALVRVYTRLQSFRHNAAFSTWLFRIVTNTCLDELRRRGRVRYTSLDAEIPQPVRLCSEAASHDGNSLTEHTERRELQAAIHRAIGQLPKEYRTVVILRDLQEYSYQEIADLLGTSVGTIKSRLHRARQALRHVIQTTEAKRLELSRIAG